MEQGNQELKKVEDLTADHLEVMPIKQLADLILSSRWAPKALDTVDKIIIALQAGKELGFAPLTALNYIHIIEGKPTLSVHALAALLKKAKVEYKLIEDYVNVYADGTTSKDDVYEFNEDGSIKTIKVKKKISDEKGAVKEVEIEETVKKKPIDRRTTIRFYKYWNGVVIENDISFTWKEAMSQGLVEKSNWIKMGKIMLRTRCLSIGARFVAPEAMLGMYETAEMLDTMNIEYELDEDGRLINVKK